MDALVITAPGAIEAGTHPDPEPAPGEVLVELRAAALNHRDLYVLDGRFGNAEPPLVPGSDGAGVRANTGEEVVIFPSLAWGGREEAPGEDFRILGVPDQGTFAQLIAVPEENVFPKPERLSWAEAAAFPLAGLTAYRALFYRAHLHADDTVLVLGAGGGVAGFAVQLASQVGARVLVTSSSDEKIEAARRVGADGGVLYTDPAWPDQVRELTGGRGADVILDSVGSTWPDSLRALCRGGRLVAFGATGGADVQLSARDVYFGQWSLLGTTMGSPTDFRGLLRLIDGGSWCPAIDSVRPLAEGKAAFERLRAGEQTGKLVLEIASSVE